ncbi:MAG: hypothetical protein ACRCXZ_01875 [Patescibacteria group bacterium]
MFLILKKMHITLIVLALMLTVFVSFGFNSSSEEVLKSTQSSVCSNELTMQDCLIEPAKDCGKDEKGEPIPLEICETNIGKDPIVPIEEGPSKCGILPPSNDEQIICYNGGNGCSPILDDLTKEQCVPRSTPPVEGLPIDDTPKQDEYIWKAELFECRPYKLDSVEVKACPVTIKNETDPQDYSLKLVIKDGCPLYYNAIEDKRDVTFTICEISYLPILPINEKPDTNNCIPLNPESTKINSLFTCNPMIRTPIIENVSNKIVALNDNSKNKLLEVDLNESISCEKGIVGTVSDPSAEVTIHLKNDQYHKTIKPKVNKTGEFAINQSEYSLPDGNYIISYSANNKSFQTNENSFKTSIKNKCNNVGILKPTKVATVRTGGSDNSRIISLFSTFAFLVIALFSSKYLKYKFKKIYR